MIVFWGCQAARIKDRVDAARGKRKVGGAPGEVERSRRGRGSKE